MFINTTSFYCPSQKCFIYSFVHSLTVIDLLNAYVYLKVKLKVTNNKVSRVLKQWCVGTSLHLLVRVNCSIWRNFIKKSHCKKLNYMTLQIYYK